MSRIIITLFLFSLSGFSMSFDVDFLDKITPKYETSTHYIDVTVSPVLDWNKYEVNLSLRF